MSKTIWIINHFATLPSAPGGTRHYDFGVELAKRGYEVTIFASDFNYMLRKRIGKGESCVYHAISEGRPSHGHLRFVWVRSLRYRKNNWRRAANMLSFALNVIVLGIMRKRPDLVIGSSPHLLAALAAYILAKARASEFYLEVRDLWPQVLIDMGAAAEESIQIVLLRKIETLLYREADRIIVLSHGTEEYIARRGVDPDRILMLPNGVYIESFEVTESRDSIRQRLDLADKFVVMYAGAHGPANALDTILDAGSRMRSEVAFVLIGDGPCKDELQKMVAEKGLDNVKMLPAVPKESIPDLLNAADALVITLRSVDLFSYGVSPNKLFEYMASSRPIICAVNGEVASLVTRADAGITVKPEDPEAMSQAISFLMENGDRCSVYGANGRRFVEENFSRSRMANDLVSIIGH